MTAEIPALLMTGRGDEMANDQDLDVEIPVRKSKKYTAKRSLALTPEMDAELAELEKAGVEVPELIRMLIARALPSIKRKVAQGRAA